MKYYTIITDKGFEKEQLAKTQGRTVRLKEIALGDAEYEPQSDQTALMSEVYRTLITRTYKDTANPNAVLIEAALPEHIGGFMIKEVGIYDEDGDLFAVAKYPETYKPVLADGSTKDLYMRFILAFSNVPAITLFINPNIAIPSVDAIQVLIQESVGTMADMILDELQVFVRNDYLVGGIIGAPVASMAGFLICDGAAVSRTTYAKLFAKIGTVFGVGNGSSTFALPDYRGLFLRGLGGNAATNFTDTQGDAIRNIWGEFGQWKFQIHAGTIVSAGTGSGGKSNSSDGGADPWWRSRFSADQQVPTANENRPVNKAVNWFIKY